MSCQQVWQEISRYIDGDTAPLVRARMDHHVSVCPKCKAVLAGARNVVQLAGCSEAFEPPSGFSKRLYSKLENYIADQPAPSPRTIEVGITQDRVPLGSHLIYFCEGSDDFERGVRFLYPGLGKGEHCLLFGHDEAIEQAFQVLRAGGFDPEASIRNLELTVIHRMANAQQTVSEIAAVLDRAMRAGATAVRYLGILGMGRDPLPAGEDDVVELEQKVDLLVASLPCVTVCMYDVRMLSGRLVMRGGLQTHALAVCAAGVHTNPYFVPQEDSVRARHIH
jgi:hypothetical protein